MRKLISILGWGAVGALGATAIALLALHRGETINAAWLVVALALMAAVVIVLAASMREWLRVWRSREPANVPDAAFPSSAVPVTTTNW